MFRISKNHKTNDRYTLKLGEFEDGTEVFVSLKKNYGVLGIKKRMNPSRDYFAELGDKERRYAKKLYGLLASHKYNERLLPSIKNN